MNFRGPLFLTLLTALVLVLIGLYFVERQRAVSPNGASATWETQGGYLETTGQASVPETNPQPNVVAADNNPEILTIPAATTTTPKRPISKDDGAFGYNALLEQLRHEGGATASQQTNKTYEELLEAFSFAPTITEPSPKVKTPEQQAMFAYGNEIGTRLRGFAAVNFNMTQTLTDQINHRTNQSKNNAVRDLGLRYRTLGENILAISSVPPAFTAAHKTLGESYVLLGSALSRVPDATEDQAFIAAITVYNNKADAYTSAFVGMVTLFSANNIEFQETDAGSVFSFRRN